ncbi:MAG: P-loop NTPase [Candidatus Hodarchaeaceae archaeon]|nr:P-loop NTPase [Candidatus Hodarchaeaceae archaeon]
MKELLRGFKRGGRRIEIKPRRARVVGVFSCKGGVGKTTTAANLGMLLAERLGNGVIVIEANLSAPNLGLHLGIIDPKVTIHDVLAGAVPIERATNVVGGKLHAVPGSVAYEGGIPLVDLKGAIEPTRSKYKLIIIDSAPGLGAEAVAAIKACDEMLVVTNPEIPTIASTLRTFRAAQRYRIPITGVVVNKIMGKRYEVPLSEIRKTLGWPIIATVPDDDKVRESLTAGIPVVRYSPKSRAARAFRELADRTFEKLFKEGKRRQPSL